jgi:cell cycle checkpoint protein
VWEEAELDNEAVRKGSQKFLRTKSSAQNTALPPPPLSPTSEDQRPWNEKYGPNSLDELAVHKKKVFDVRTWLCDVFGGRERKRLLLLKGPAGSGKTTTMSLLSKELGIEIHEWKNPTTMAYSEEGFVSITAQFEDFVGRTGRFGSLAFDDTSNAAQGLTPPTPSRQKQLVLVEEFPNTFTRSSSAVRSFRASVQHFLAANTPAASVFFSGQRDDNITPIVMIISETLLSTNTAAADSFTAHRLLGPEILTHPGATVIEFNPIAPTLMTKALELVVLKEARKSGRRKTPGPQVLKRLSEIGDVRSAVSSLEFLCIRGDDDDGWGSKVAFTKPKKASKETPALTKMEQESLEMVTQRESTLGIFHAVGKVVYNKRITDDPNTGPIPQPPNWFPEYRRPKASEVDVDALIDELGTDTHTFISALHENYILSCEGSTSEDTVDCMDACIEALSNADLLSTDRFSSDSYGRRSFQGSTADTLRQDEMSFQSSVRGLLFGLPSPVKRIAPSAGTMTNKGKGSVKGSAFQMYYPASLRLWRQQEELAGLLDMWISRAQRGELFASSSRMKAPEAKPGTVESWRKSTPASQSIRTSTDASAPEEPPTTILLGSGSSARHEMLLERLPYLPVIMRKSSVPFTSSMSSAIRDIKKITSFTGIGVSASEEDLDEGDDDVPEQEQWTTDAPNSPVKKRKLRNKIEVKGADSVSALPGIADTDVQRLVLSDDDIEDL